MSELNELTQITIDDKEKEIQDIAIELNTGELGAVQFTTDKLKGCLYSFILSSPRIINFKIESELGYPIFHSKEYEGTTYILPRTEAWDEDSHRLSFSAEEFLLNESLIITIQGPSNTDVKILFRFKD